MHAGQAEHQHDANRSNYCIYHRYLKAQRWKATGQKGRDFAGSGGKLQGSCGGFCGNAVTLERAGLLANAVYHSDIIS
jgi:hypothetical protein